MARIIKEFNENKKNLNIWIDAEVKDKLKIQAKKHGLLFGRYIERVLKQAVDAKVKTEEETE